MFQRIIDRLRPAPARERPRRRWRSYLVDLVIAGGVVAAVSAWQARGLLDAGRPAPSLALPTLEGAPFDPAGLRGRKAVVAFWAPWCGVCKVEMPTLNALAGDGVPVIGVALAYPDPASVRRFAEEHEIAFPTLLGDEKVGREWKVDAFPTLYVLDEDGRIEHAVVGYTTGLGIRLRLL